MNEQFTRAGAIVHVDLAHEPDFVMGALEVRPSRCAIIGAGWQETLEPRVMQVLVALARKRGETLSRDELIESCWGGVIVGEGAINRCISQLRKIAAARGNAFSIETVSRVGYRLEISTSAALSPGAERHVAPEQNLMAPPPMTTLAKASWFARTKWIAAATTTAGVLVLAGLGLWIVQLRPTRAPLGFTNAVAAPKESVAVLPFINLSGDPTKQYFSDGFSEELLNDLSNDPRLRVAARTSAFAFKDRNEDIATIAHALHVRDIVEGSVREAGNRVRITVQLIDARDGYNIWSATYDRNLADILGVQDEVARAVAASLTHKLVPPPTGPRRKIDPAIYRLYLQGRQQLARASADGNRRAYAIFKRVTAAQPDFAAGFSALARAAYLSSHDPAHTASDIAAATEAAQSALSLDSRNIEARVLREELELAAWNWGAAAADVRVLRTESLNNMNVLTGLRDYYYDMGFPDRTITISRRMMSLNPVSDVERLETVFYVGREDHYDEEINVARTILAHQPNHIGALSLLCEGYAYTGRTREARETDDRLHRLTADPHAQSDEPHFCDCQIDINTGNLVEATNMVERWAEDFPDRWPDAYALAEWYMWSNNFDKASDWYERAYERREFKIFRDVYWKDSAQYRTTPRWIALTQKPLFMEWQAKHDKIAAELAVHGGNPF